MCSLTRFIATPTATATSDKTFNLTLSVSASPGTVMNDLTKCASFNNVRDRYPHSASVVAFDGHMVPVFRDDGSDHGSVNRPQSRRTAYHSVEHNSQVITETIPDTMRRKKGTGTSATNNRAIHDAFTLSGRHCFSPSY